MQQAGGVLVAELITGCTLPVQRGEAVLCSPWELCSSCSPSARGSTAMQMSDPRHNMCALISFSLQTTSGATTADLGARKGEALATNRHKIPLQGMPGLPSDKGC